MSGQWTQFADSLCLTADPIIRRFTVADRPYPVTRRARAGRERERVDNVSHLLSLRADSLIELSTGMVRRGETVSTSDPQGDGGGKDTTRAAFSACSSTNIPRSLDSSLEKSPEISVIRLPMCTNKRVTRHCMYNHPCRNVRVQLKMHCGSCQTVVGALVKGSGPYSNMRRRNTINHNDVALQYLYRM